MGWSAQARQVKNSTWLDTIMDRDDPLLLGTRYDTFMWANLNWFEIFDALNLFIKKIMVRNETQMSQANIFIKWA